MNEPERAEVPASQEALRYLVKTALQRLVAYGEREPAVGDYGERAGLPIVYIEESFVKEIPADALIREVPAAEGLFQLEPEDALRVAGSLPHFEHDEPGSEEYNSAALYFNTKKPSPDEVREIFIHQPSATEDNRDEAPFESMKHFNATIPPGGTNEERLFSVIEAAELERKLGWSILTSGECVTLQTIVDHLDTL